MEEKSVDQYIVKQDKWIREMEFLRKTFISMGMKETLKWGFPVYVVNNQNVVGLAGFKSYTGIWFFQGALLNDNHKLLINAQEGKTTAMRQIRFNSFEQLMHQAEQVESYIQEAIKNAKEGKKIAPKKAKPLVIPGLLEELFQKQPNVKEKFESLNLTRKREFSDYIESAKREATKLKRLDIIIPLILDGQGLYDKYKK